MGNFILLFIGLFLIWSGLVFPISGQEIMVGGALSFLISLLVAIRMKDRKTFKLSGIFSMIKFIFIFAIELVKANFAIAKIVLNPKLPISPKIVKIKTDINSKVARVFLANSITLTPGTLSIDLEDEYLYIHVVDGDNLKDPKDILLPFEESLKGAFDR